MATTLTRSFSLDSQHHHHHHNHHSLRHLYANDIHSRLHQSPPPFLTTSAFKLKHPLFAFHKYERYTPTPLSSHSSPPSTPTTSSSSYLQDPLRPGRFLSNEELEKLKILDNFGYYQELESGSMWVRVMRDEEIGVTVELLSESFAESMLLPMGYVKFLAFLVKQYLTERRVLMPHMAMLVGFYRGKGEEGGEEHEQMAGTVEVSFDKKGANASPPTPTPPKNKPYICNMSVKKPLRRYVCGGV